MTGTSIQHASVTSQEEFAANAKEGDDGQLVTAKPELDIEEAKEPLFQTTI